MPKTVFIGADHRGFGFKQELYSWLQLFDELDVQDLGNTVFDQSDDFTNYAFAVAEHVRDNPESRGLLICHSAVGMCIAANKVRGIRAGQGSTVAQVIEDRQHNDIQVLCLSSEVHIDLARSMILAFLETEFSGQDRYKRRVEQISQYEQRKS